MGDRIFNQRGEGQSFLIYLPLRSFTKEAILVSFICGNSHFETIASATLWFSSYNVRIFCFNV